MNLHIIENALPNAFTIAVLAAIESLLSCVVADGMINGKHRSDMELVAQGAVISPLLYSEVSLPQERSQEPLPTSKMADAHRLPEWCTPSHWSSYSSY